jgi:hypothetical protein
MLRGGVADGDAQSLAGVAAEFGRVTTWIFVIGIFIHVSQIVLQSIFNLLHMLVSSNVGIDMV